MAADLRAAGRTTPARAYDVVVAAVAVSQDLPLYTVNPDDFDQVSDLDVVVVPHPDHD